MGGGSVVVVLIFLLVVMAFFGTGSQSGIAVRMMTELGKILGGAGFLYLLSTIVRFLLKR